MIGRRLLWLCAAALIVVAAGSCAAYTVDDCTGAIKQLAAGETYAEGIKTLAEISADTAFVSAHPEETASARVRLAGDMLEVQKKPLEAVAMLDKAMAVAPAGSDIRRSAKDSLAWACYASGDAPRAVDLCKQLIAEYPTDSIVRWNITMSEAYGAQGQYDKAALACADAVKAAPQPADAVPALRNMAYFQHRQGLYQDEIGTLMKIVSTVPDTPDAGHAAQSVDVVTALYLPAADMEALSTAKRQEVIRSLMSFGKASEDKYGEGLAAVKKALELGPDDPKLVVECDYSLADRYRANANYELAIAMGEKLLADCKGLDDEKQMMFEAKMLMGFGYQCLGKYDKAIPPLRDVAERLDPKCCGAMYNLATCCNMTGKYDDAITYYDRVVANGDCPAVAGECLLEKATMLVSKLQKLDEGIAAYKQAFTVVDVPRADFTADLLKAIELAKPGASGASTIIAALSDVPAETKAKLLPCLAGVVGRELARPEQAKPIYVAALAITANSAKRLEINLEMANCCRNAGDWAGAIESFRAYCASDPPAEKAAEAMRTIGDCYMRKGDPAGAKAAFQDLVNRFPDSREAEIARVHVTALAQVGEGGASK